MALAIIAAKIGQPYAGHWWSSARPTPSIPITSKTPPDSNISKHIVSGEDAVNLNIENYLEVDAERFKIVRPRELRRHPSLRDKITHFRLFSVIR